MDETRAAHSTEAPDFDTLADDYARFRTSYSAQLFDAILRFGPTPPGARVLDLACGTGLGMTEYVRRGYRVVGVDVATVMMEQARTRFAGEPQVQFVEGKAEELPFADASFDLISCAQAFHWFEPEAAFAECARVLRPGGTLAIFWKHAARDDQLTQTCEQIIREWLGEDAAVRSRDHASEHEAGWPVFWEFAARPGDVPGERPFVDACKVVIDFELARTADEFVGYQRSREKIRHVLGERRTDFLSELERRLGAVAPDGVRVRQRQIQYVFLARRAGVS
jgi:ubiquinone/menaquinone biosynthesis C-methylase UbiE